MLNLVGRRYWYFGFSLLVMIPGIIALGMWGLPLAIDFTGGSKLEVRVTEAAKLSTRAVDELLDGVGFGDNVVQLSDDNVVIIRTKRMDDASKGICLVSRVLVQGLGGRLLVVLCRQWQLQP